MLRKCTRSIHINSGYVQYVDMGGCIWVGIWMVRVWVRCTDGHIGGAGMVRMGTGVGAGADGSMYGCGYSTVRMDG